MDVTTGLALVSYSFIRNETTQCFFETNKKNPPKMEENGARMLLCHRKILKNRTVPLYQEEEFLTSAVRLLLLYV